MLETDAEMFRIRELCAPGERTFYRVKVPSPPGSGKG